MAHMVRDPVDGGMTSQWQPSILSGGLHGMAQADPRLGGEVYLFSGGAAGGAPTGGDYHVAPGGVGFLLPAPAEAAAAVVYSKENLFIPNGHFRGLTNAASLPNSITLPPGFSILPEEDAAGPSGAAYLAARIVKAEELAVSEATTTAGAALTALAGGGGAAKRYKTTAEFERESATAVATAAGAKDSSYASQREALIDLIRSATDRSQPPRAVREASLTRVITERLHCAAATLSSSMDGCKGIRDLDDSLHLAVMQAMFLMPLPTPLLVAMAEERAGIPSRPAAIRALTLVPYHSFIGALLLTDPIPKIIAQGLRSWGKPSGPGGVHGNKLAAGGGKNMHQHQQQQQQQNNKNPPPLNFFSPPDAAATFIDDSETLDPEMSNSSSGNSSEYAERLEAVRKAGTALLNPIAASRAKGGSVVTSVGENAKVSPSVYAPRPTPPEAVPDSLLPHALASALSTLSSQSKVRQLISERVEAAKAAADPIVRALARWGFARMSHLVRMPPQELLPAIADAYPPLPPPGANHVTACACALVGTLPPLGVATLLAGCVESWLSGDPAAEAAAGARMGAYDARYTRGPTDPKRTGGVVSERERILQLSLQGLNHVSMDVSVDSFTKGSAIGGDGGGVSLDPAMPLGWLQPTATISGKFTAGSPPGGRAYPGRPGVRQSLAAGSGVRGGVADSQQQQIPLDTHALTVARRGAEILNSGVVDALADENAAWTQQLMFQGELKKQEEEDVTRCIVSAAKGLLRSDQHSLEGVGVSMSSWGKIQAAGEISKKSGVYVMREPTGKRPLLPGLQF